ncbi:hypothetical protein JEZ13_10750 [bacterium]|nr:hypothetical protein [bacterium]
MVDKKALLAKIEYLQTAYQKRDLSKLDEFMDYLYGDNEKFSMIGTSDNEVYFTKENAKKLYAGDWQYWGDLVLNLEQAEIRITSDTGWIHVPGSVKYVFSTDDNVYKKFLGFIEEFYDGKSYDSSKPVQTKLTEINWLLAHLLHDRMKDKPRKYFWELRLFLIFQKVGNDWFLQHSQFSFPKEGNFPDERFSTSTYYERSFERECLLYQQNTNYSQLEKEIKSQVESFGDRLFSLQGEGKCKQEDLFSDNVWFINSDKQKFSGRRQVAQQIDKIMKQFTKIKLNLENSIWGKGENGIWVNCNGLYTKRIEKDDLFMMTEERVRQILASDRSEVDKLFMIRRDISTALKEDSLGEDYIYPFRFDAYFIFEDKLLLCDYLQISLPLDNILEQINDDF